MRSAPVLVTERLTLGPVRPSDLDDSGALWSDPLVVRFIGGRPLSREEVWSRLLRYAGLWSLLGYGYWMMRETTSGRFVGEIGFVDYRRDMVPSLAEAPEAGWVLAPWAHGRGFAGEALRAVLDWADATLNADRTVCIIDPAHEVSMRLARRFGYITYARGLYRGSEMVLFERHK